MPIDVDTPGSPGAWLRELSNKLVGRQLRLAELEMRYRGQAPLPAAANPDSSASYQAFRRSSRTNFGQLIVNAPKQRMRVLGFRTGADQDDNGDREARRIWDENDLDVESTSVHASMLAMGDAYVIVGADEGGRPVITAEDPRQVVTFHDELRQRVVRAALKMFVDVHEGREYAYLYLPGELHVASHEIGRGSRARSVRFAPKSWDWDEERSGLLPFDTVPVVRFRNGTGVGEFEEHIDLLDRIDLQVFQRLVIATMQAYKQRIVLDGPSIDSETGEEIDYGILKAGPDEVWQLPMGAKLWESGQVDLTPILSAVKDDLRALSAVTQTPFHMLSPEGANQSAEGASLSREGLVAKTREKIASATGAWKDVMSLAFLIVGDEQRAQRFELDVLWEDPEHRSLAEIADAASKAQDVPWATRMAKIWRFTPTEIGRMESERAADRLIEQAFALPAQLPAQQASPVADQPVISGSPASGA